MNKMRNIVEVSGLHFFHVSYLTITQKAMYKMQSLLMQKPDVIGFLVTLSQKGCAGFAYKLEYARENINLFENFELVIVDGMRVFINPKISLYIIGTQMDYVEEKTHSGFVFINPNEKGKCGCGESFFVDSGKVH